MVCVELMHLLCVPLWKALSLKSQAHHLSLSVVGVVTGTIAKVVVRVAVAVEVEVVAVDEIVVKVQEDNFLRSITKGRDYSTKTMQLI